MAREVTKEEAEEIIAENRHRELTGALKSIAVNLSRGNDKEVVEAINKQGSNFDELIKAIKSIPQSETPEVNITLNPKEFVSSINKICEDIIASNNKVIEALNTRLLPDTFTLIKSYGGVTESVKVDYKEANKIVVKNTFKN